MLIVDGNWTRTLRRIKSLMPSRLGIDYLTALKTTITRRSVSLSRMPWPAGMRRRNPSRNQGRSRETGRAFHRYKSLEHISRPWSCDRQYQALPGFLGTQLLWPCVHSFPRCTRVRRPENAISTRLDIRRQTRSPLRQVEFTRDLPSSWSRRGTRNHETHWYFQLHRSIDLRCSQLCKSSPLRPTNRTSPIPRATKSVLPTWTNADSVFNLLKRMTLLSLDILPSARSLSSN